MASKSRSRIYIGDNPPAWIYPGRRWLAADMGDDWCWLLYRVQHFAEGGNVFGAELAKDFSLTVVSYFP